MRNGPGNAGEQGTKVLIIPLLKFRKKKLISHGNEHEESVEGKSHIKLFSENKEQTNIPPEKESRPGKCAQKTAQNSYHFKTNPRDLKKMVQDVKEQHISELEKLGIEMTDLRKELG